MSQVDVLVDAIERREGFGKPHALPTRLNNPGDLMFAHQVGASPHTVVGTDGKPRTYAEFATLELGTLALQRQIMLDARRGLTVAQFIEKYAPSADGNDSKAYLEYCCKHLVAEPQARLYDVLYGAPSPRA